MIFAEELGVSGQTIYRDVDFLTQHDYCNRFDTHADGWAYHLLAEPATVSNGKGHCVNDRRNP